MILFSLQPLSVCFLRLRLASIFSSFSSSYSLSFPLSLYYLCLFNRWETKLSSRAYSAKRIQWHMLHHHPLCPVGRRRRSGVPRLCLLLGPLVHRTTAMSVSSTRFSLLPMHLSLPLSSLSIFSRFLPFC